MALRQPEILDRPGTRINVEKNRRKTRKDSDKTNVCDGTQKPNIFATGTYYIVSDIIFCTCVYRNYFLFVNDFLSPGTNQRIGLYLCIYALRAEISKPYFFIEKIFSSICNEPSVAKHAKVDFTSLV